MSVIKAFAESGFAAGVKLALAGKKITADELAALATAGSTDECCVAVDICGVDVNAADAAGWPAAVLAAKAGKYDTALTFFERGAKPDLAGPDGTTALHYAAQGGNTELVKALVLFGASKLPEASATTADKAAAKEAEKKRPAPEKLEAMAAKFKALGNKVFAEGEFVKAAKLYSAAITHAPETHVFFSNRSACAFNGKVYPRSFGDASRCVNLAPAWAKGYFRKGSCLQQMELEAEALKVR